MSAKTKKIDNKEEIVQNSEQEGIELPSEDILNDENNLENILPSADVDDNSETKEKIIDEQEDKTSLSDEQEDNEESLNVSEDMPLEKKDEVEEKTICRVIVATPSYFVIQKENKVIRVDEKNNYIRGEEIIF